MQRKDSENMDLEHCWSYFSSQGYAWCKQKAASARES